MYNIINKTNQKEIIGGIKMGATTFTIKAKGNNVRQVFNDLVEDAIMRYGHDSYNGTISTTSLADKVYIPENLLKGKNKDKKINNYIDENYEDIFYDKYETRYADLGVDHYKSYSAEWQNYEYTPKREKGVRTLTKFSLVEKDGERFKTKTYQSLKVYDTLAEAKRGAKEMALRKGEAITIKKHRSNGEMFTLGHIDLVSDGKKYKSARTAKTKIYKPIYEFMFFVYAAC